MESLASIICRVLKRMLLPTEDLVLLHSPTFNGNEWNYVKECIDTGWVSSAGKYVDLFEKKLEEYTGVKRAIATCNGTAALHICLIMAGVNRNDEVLIPALSFVASANAVKYCDAIPHFIDSEEATLGLDLEKLDVYLNDITEIINEECFNKQTRRRIKVVMPMHTFGHPVRMDELLKVAKKYHLVVVEDAAESIGSYYKGTHTGGLGLLSALSFNGNKTITTGGGGAILTNDESLADLAKHITTTAKLPHKWEYNHDRVGYNYRMPNINAALGCAQLEQLPEFLEKKRVLANRYAEAFSNVDGVRFISEPINCKSNYWLNAILLDERYVSELEKILSMTNGSKIMTRPAWTLLNRLTMYSSCPAMDLSIASKIGSGLINIPSSITLAKNI